MPLSSNDHLHERLASWFPLLPRPRPACRALTERVDEINHLAHTAAHGPPEQRITTAAEACNKAALILSDCGLPDRAHQLCRRQFDLFHAHRPLAPTTAKLALQPLVNLGRLHIRNGHGNRAHQLLTHVYQALRTRTATTIDGRNIDLTDLTDDHRAARGDLVRFLWTVLLADGTRALTRAGRWNDALEHLERHKGIGDRMLDGRQVAVLTRIVNDDHEHALDLLAHSSTPETWEQAVASYLTTLCLTTAERDTQPADTDMVERYLALPHQSTPPVFRCRLGLCVLDLTNHTPITTDIIRQAITAADAYAAHDVLTHPACAQNMSDTDQRALTHIITTAGLHHGEEAPAEPLTELTDAIARSETSLAHALTRQQSTHDQPRRNYPSTTAPQPRGGLGDDLAGPTDTAEAAPRGMPRY
ncbi:hypothetical protein FHR84_000497 [Actinopolyspora biskrensis]|uniref:Uncharacterized protein n=1 Tax=Actinopolyspora biskrensis TaxID=1470178 RepID=A0A852Z4J7_9ACTN|nr:hypothetical protein [Actinopolyspora biskrensis]NYH77183.1 hypothetical protein [Actinopolyspora biskrensis]